MGFLWQCSCIPVWNSAVVLRPALTGDYAGLFLSVHWWENLSFGAYWTLWVKWEGGHPVGKVAISVLLSVLLLGEWSEVLATKKKGPTTAILKSTPHVHRQSVTYSDTSCGCSAAQISHLGWLAWPLTWDEPFPVKVLVFESHLFNFHLRWTLIF